jgi:putative ABC transport system ATP-binding protein
VSEPMVLLKDIVKRHPGRAPLESLRGVNLRIEAGDLTAVLGPSGSGKTTLLHIMGTLDRATSGSVQVGGVETSTMTDAELCAFRASCLGFVFQQFFLVEAMSVLDNVACGLLYRGVDPRTRRCLAEQALERVGLASRTRHRPNQLSGGERQRTAIARALVGRPPLLLADEPTGNLDSAAGAVVVDLLKDLNRDGTTVVVITHNHEVASAMSRQIVLKDGRVEGDTHGATGR